MTLDDVLPIEDGFLRPLDPSDVTQHYVDGLNDPRVNTYLDGVRRMVQTIETVTAFVATDKDASDATLFGIWLEESQRHVGTVRLHNIDTCHGYAYIGICIFDLNAWGKNLGSRAIGAVTDWAQRAYDLDWIEAGIYPENVASQRVFIKAGYTHQCTFESKYRRGGHNAPVMIFAATQ